MRKSLIISMLAMAAVCLFAGAVLAAPVTLTYSVFFPPTHPQAQAAVEWAKEIEKRTNGEIKIEVIAGGTLTKAPEVYKGVVDGISDLGMSCFAYTAGQFPVMSALDLPMGYPNGTVASQVANAFAKQANPSELSGAKVLYVHAHGPGLLHTQKPVARLEDLSKMKIRATGFSAKVATALGAVPVAMSQGEAYEALKSGVVEGTFTPIETLKGWKQAEVVKSTTNCKSVGYTTAMFVVMNKAKWDALSPAAQKVFTDVSAKWVGVHGAAWDKADEDGKKFTLEKGNKFIELSPAENARWKKAVEPVIAAYQTETPNGKLYVAQIKALIKKFSAPAKPAKAAAKAAPKKK